MISKKAFKYKDRLIKGISEDGHFKISVVKTSDVVRAAKKKHQLTLLNTVLLGRTLTGALLMASELKGEERIQLKAEGNGPVGQVVAEANRVGEVRGYVQNPAASVDTGKKNASIRDGLGIGLLTVTKTLYNEATPQQSTIKLIKSNITDDLAFYMAQSEQLPSAVMLDVGIDKKGRVSEAGGILIQRMPDAEEGQIEHLQQKLASFGPLHKLFAEGNYIDDIMHAAMQPISVKELDRQPVDFFCRCSRDRFLDSLAMLNYDDLKAMGDEGQELVCHFCNKKYQISKDEIKKITLQAKARMN